MTLGFFAFAIICSCIGMMLAQTIAVMRDKGGSATSDTITDSPLRHL